FVKLAPPGHAESFGHGDLHASDVVAVPDGFEERVGETEEEQVLDGFLAEVVIDAENGRLGKGRMQSGIELLRGSQVAAKGLFENYARALGAAGFVEAVDYGCEHAGGNGQV